MQNGNSGWDLLLSEGDTPVHDWATRRWHALGEVEAALRPHLGLRRHGYSRVPGLEVRRRRPEASYA